MAWRIKVTAHLTDGRTVETWATATVGNPLIAPDCASWDDDELPEEMYGSKTQRMVWELVQISDEEARAIEDAAAKVLDAKYA